MLQWADMPIVDVVAISYLKAKLKTLGIDSVIINIYETVSVDGVDKIVLTQTGERYQETDDSLPGLVCKTNTEPSCIEIKLLKNDLHYNALVKQSDTTELGIIPDDFVSENEIKMIKKHANISK